MPENSDFDEYDNDVRFVGLEDFVALYGSKLFTTLARTMNQHHWGVL